MEETELSHNKHVARRWQRRALGVETPSRWRKKILGIPLIGWLLGLAIPAAALVGFVLLFGATGSLTSSDGLDVEITTVSGVNHGASATPATCAITEPQPDVIDIQVSGFDPGDICQFQIGLRNNGNTQAAIEGFLTDSADWSDGDVLVEHLVCGAAVSAGGGTATSTVFFTGQPTIVPSQSFTFDPAFDGLSVVPAGTADPGKCIEGTP